MLSAIEPQLQAWFRAYDARALAAFRRIKVETKADGTTVTAVDRETSAEIVADLRRLFPDHGILSEEEGEPHRPDAEWLWVIDPLDGTASFARSHPVWGLGIGLLHRREPVAGFLRYPAVDETYACQDGRVRLNGMPFAPGPSEFTCDTRNVLTASQLHREIPYQKLERIKLRNYGSNLYHLVLVGLGRAEAVLVPRCYLWDVAAGLPFTRAAGCIERYADGTPFELAHLFASPGKPYRLAKPLIVGYPAQVEELLARLAG
jgi:fructose-1,6-bisphosphatase/inositol monophosphatase family enzyme